MNVRQILLMAAVALAAAVCATQAGKAGDVVAPGAQVKKLAGDFKFLEGPAADAAGNVYFSDIPNERVHKWSVAGKLTTFREQSGRSNGLFFDKAGNLLACEGGARQVTSTDMKGKTTVIVDAYEGKKLNSPNDLWLAPTGGIYFTDPRYGRDKKIEQDGEHVYYISPDRKKVIRVVDDMVRPNGVIGTADGKTLYVTDHGGGKTFVYAIQPDGTLADKKLFCEKGSDGMTIDERGNVYLTSGKVWVYSPAGKLIREINTPEGPANASFGGPDRKTLFLTARKSLYSVRMAVRAQPRPDLRPAER
jgi:gluconolactonase